MDNPFKNLSNGEKIAVGAGALVVVYFAYRQHQASAGSSAAASASAIDPLTGLPASEDNQTDPLTGETYLGEAQQYGSVTAAEQALSGGSLGSQYTGYGAVGYDGNYNQGTSGITTVGGTAYATNAAWAQAVEAGLTDIGYAPTDVSAALGRYLGNLSETSAQATIVQAAIAEYGPPPVGSYQIIMQTSTGGGGSGGGGTEVTIPDVAGTDVEQATGILKDAGLKVSGPPGQKGIVHVVTSATPAVGTKVKTGTTVTLHYKSVKEK